MGEKITDDLVGTTEGCGCCTEYVDPLLHGGQADGGTVAAGSAAAGTEKEKTGQSQQPGTVHTDDNG